MQIELAKFLAIKNLVQIKRKKYYRCEKSIESDLRNVRKFINYLVQHVVILNDFEVDEQ